MATPLIDNIDSYTVTSITGQGTWSGSANYLVQSSVVQGGTNAISDAIGGATIDATFTQAATGNQQAWGRATDVTTVNLWTLKMSEAGTNIADIRTNAGNLEYYGNGAFHTLGAVSANTWWQVNIKWNASQNTIAYSLNGGAFTTPASALGDMTNGLDRVHLDNGTASGGSIVYFDSFSDGNAVAATDIPNTLPLRALMGVGI